MRLPRSAQEFERVIGRELTLKLAEDVAPLHKGVVYVPTKAMRDDHRIVRSIGREAADVLQKQFGGSLMRLASCKTFKRHRSIAAGFVSGWTRTRLSEFHGVSSRTVHTALERVTTGDLTGCYGMMQNLTTR